jgi:hypothetical protein
MKLAGFYRGDFAEKNISFTTNLSAEHNAANFFLVLLWDGLINKFQLSFDYFISAQTR